MISLNTVTLVTIDGNLLFNTHTPDSEFWTFVNNFLTTPENVTCSNCQQLILKVFLIIVIILARLNNVIH